MLQLSSLGFGLEFTQITSQIMMGYIPFVVFLHRIFIGMGLSLVIKVRKSLLTLWLGLS